MGTFVVTNSDASAAERLAEQAGLFNSTSGSSSTSSTAVQPERLTAQTDKDAASQALGRPLPAVIGTGRVDGIYFIGGVVQIDTITTTTTTTTDPPEGFFVSVANDANEAQLLAGQAWLFAKKTTTIDSTTSSETATKAGYVLAYDFFERGYDLIRLEIDGAVVYDVENQVFDPTVAVRYYGGRHTAVDPIVAEIIGANAGAYENMVMVFIEGYPADTPPSISAVISNAAEDGPETVIIAWTGTTPDEMYDRDSITTSIPTGSSYDIGAGLLYSMILREQIPSLTAIMLVVIDVGNSTELYRVPLADSAAYLDQTQSVYAIRGGDFVIVKLVTGDDLVPKYHRIYNSQTGAVVAQYIENIATERVNEWQFGMPFQGKQVMFGFNSAPSPYGGVAVGLFDPYGATISIQTETDLSAGLLVRGRTTDSTVSAFGRSNDGATVYEYVFDGTNITVRTVALTMPTLNQSLWYEPDTGYLISQGSSFAFHYYDPDTGDAIATWTDTTYPTLLLTNMVGVGTIPGQPERFWTKDGFVFATQIDILTNEIYLVDVRNRKVSLWASGPIDTDTVWYDSFFDQVHGLYIEGFGDARHWTIHRLPSAIPGLIDLQDAVTDVMYLAGFGSGDLTFNGFDGLTTYGFVIAADTNIQSAVKTLSDIYDFYWCDTGSGFYYKKPGTDGSLSIDVEIVGTYDLVARDDPVQSSDEGDIRTPSAMELEYISKEGAYKSRPANFAMTTGVLNSITTPRFSTPVLFNDAEAQRLVTEKFFQAQEQRRGHSLVVPPDYITLLPGDIISFPSEATSYITVIDAIAMDFRDMSIELGVTDFQTEVATTINTVSNNPPVSVLLRFASIYIHLDIPLILYSHDLNGTGLVQYGMVAARTVSWTGGTAYRGTAATNTAPLFDQVPNDYAFGICQDVLDAPADPFGTTDNSTVTVRIVNGATTLLVDATETEVLAGKNLAAIGTNGRWELVGFTTVVENADGSFTLSGFVRRGYHGSEVWAGAHLAGDYFILLNTAVAKHVTHPISDLDATYYYKAVGKGQSPTVVGAVPHTIPGVAETPYAVRNIQGSNGGSPGGVQLFWDYRSRVADGLNPADHGEATLAFEVDILAGTSPDTVVRTLSTTTNSVAYSDAQVIADFGSYPDTLAVRVYMMSALDIIVPGQVPVVPGRGYAASAFIFLNGFGSTTFDSSTMTFDRSDVTFDRG